MKALRRFVPTSMAELEGRALLSITITGPPQLLAAMRPVKLSQAEIAQSNASAIPFGFGVSETLRSGLSVAEQVTIHYNGGSTQTESIVKVPDLAKNTVTTYETVNLRNNGGTEKVVDTQSFSGGATPLSGNDITHNVTITLPDGSTETQTYTDVITGRKTVVSGTTHQANGSVQTWTAVKIKTGPKTTTSKTITEPDGTIEHQKTIATNMGILDSTSKTVTTIPSKDAILVSSSATNVIRVQPPSA